MDEADRFLYLPEDVIYNVMDFLPTKEVFRTSVLSKRWRRMRASYPCLDFNQTLVDMCPSDLEENRQFIRIVDENLSRFREQGEQVRKFELLFRIFEPTMASLVDRWIGLATEGRVEELHLRILYPFDSSYMYKLPETVFASSSVKVLKLAYIGLEQLLHQRVIGFRSLQKLSLVAVHVDASVIASIIATCPLIEEIELLGCLGLHEVHISGLHNLKAVSLVQNKGAIELHIEAPSLQKLSFEDGILEHSPRTIKFIVCQNLKELNLAGFLFSDQQLADLLAKFPLLEVLHLANCKLLKSVKIPNQHLRRLIFKCTGLEEAETENMIASTSPSAKWELRIDLFYSNQWFCKLRNLVAKSENLKSLTLRIHRKISFTVEEIKDIQLPSVPMIDCIVLEFGPSASDYSALLDGLLWSCHPKSLSLMFSNLDSRSEFVRIFFDKLQHKLDSNLEHSESIRGWQHELKDVEFYNGDRRAFGRSRDGTALYWFTLHANLKW